MLQQQFVFYTFFFLLLTSCAEPTETSITDKNNGDSTIENTNVQKSKAEDQVLHSPTSIAVSETQTGAEYNFGYTINRPTRKMTLDYELVEISALTFNPINNTIFAVNDEEGLLYKLDINDGSILHKAKFAGSGDYEGIEVVGNKVFVLKANGNIIPVNLKSGDVEKTFKTPLSTTNDVEGLGYNSANHELILACKGEGSLKDKSKLKSAKAIYSFDLDKEKLKKKPKFIISDKDLEKYLEKHLSDDLSKKAKKKLENRITDFSPSAIAKHPLNDHYFILSSVGKLLVVCNEEGKIMSVQFLDNKSFIQPEGICFAPNGTMYISNEGKSLKSNILTFSYR